MTIIGLDDTDIVGSRGTNQLARRIVTEISDTWRCELMMRHQLLDDPRVPYTSKNGSASIVLSPQHGIPVVPAQAELRDRVYAIMQRWYVEGSDPGLCLLHGDCPSEVMDWGKRCTHELVEKSQAYKIAEQTQVHLESLGGTEDGVIGALAAVGLAATGSSGRIIQLGEWPDDLTGEVPLSVLHQRGLQVIEFATGQQVTSGIVDVGNHLRSNRYEGQSVLWVETQATGNRPHYVRVKQH